VDVEQASASIDALLDKRARAGANAEEMMWKESVKRHNAMLRRERRTEWFCRFSALAASLRASAEGYERRAGTLLEGEGP